jgi:acetylglutamate/LysW-gamma-L-alpha-aminoadipate kinase
LLVVAKIGGSILDQPEERYHSLFEDVRLVSSEHRLILVHGGGREVTRIAEALGKKQKFIESPNGIRSRYTDNETAVIYSMVMAGKIGKGIVAALQRYGINAVGLSGVDGALLQAERKKKLVVVDDRGRKVAIEGGFTGKIQSVKTELLETLLSNRFVPVISPVAISQEYELLNVDGDRACSHVAGMMTSDTAIFLTDTDGVFLNNKLVTKWSCDQALSNLSKIGSGMDKKVIAAIEAVKMGARRSVICSGLSTNPISAGIKGIGTVITA